VHARLAVTSSVDFAAKTFVAELTDPLGGVLFRTSLSAGSMTGDPVRGKFKFRDKVARVLGGLARLKITKHGSSYRVTLQSYGDLSAAQAEMVLHVFAQNDEWTLPNAVWERTKKGWRYTGR